MAVLKLILQGQGIYWPKKCAVCGASATSTAKAECSIATKLSYRVIYLGWANQKITVNYPLCIKHKLSRFFPSLVAKRNLFNLGISFLATFCFIFGVLVRLAEHIIYDEPIQNPQLLIWFSLLFGLGVIIFLLGQRFAPIQIKDADENTITIRIYSPEYAAEFKKLNHAIIIDNG